MDPVNALKAVAKGSAGAGEIVALANMAVADPDAFMTVCNRLEFETLSSALERLSAMYLPDVWPLFATLVAGYDRIEDADVRQYLAILVTSLYASRAKQLGLLRQRLETTERQLHSVLDGLAADLADAANAEERIAMLQARLAHLRLEWERQRVRLEEAQNLQVRTAALESELKTAQSYDFDAQRERLKRLQQQIAEARATRRTVDEAARQAHDELEQQRVALLDAQREQAAVQDEAVRVRQAASEAAQRADQFQAQIEAGQQDIAEHGRRRDELATQWEGLEQEVRKAQEQLPKLDEALRGLRRIEGPVLNNASPTTPAELLNRVKEIQNLLDEKSQTGLRQQIEDLRKRLRVVDMATAILQPEARTPQMDASAGDGSPPPDRPD